jgi:flagellar basal-body rod protein FlgF
METTTYVALSRQTALRRQMGILANNLANMNTAGFKGEKMMFIEHIVKSPGGNRILPDKISYVRDIATMKDTSEGALESTGNDFDMAITGPGYFVVETAIGNRYTRNGQFQLDEGGQLVTQAGNPVLSDSNQPFIFGPTDKNVTISGDGTVSTKNGVLGRIGLVTFENEQKLRPDMGGLFSSTAAPKPSENPRISQGMLEGSNVQPIIEMSRMISVHRSYEGIKNFINKEDERMKEMIRDLAQV